MNARRLSFRHFLLHGTRVTIFVTTLLLIRWQHAKSIAQSSVFIPDLAQVVPFFPTVDQLTPRRDEAFAVLDVNDDSLGSVLQTSPQSDHIIGFSGPTNMLLAFDPDDRVLGMHAISSGDTRDHLKQVLADDAFMSSLNGLARDEVVNSTDVDAVSGATLTSLAIRESIRHRLGGVTSQISLRFGEPLSVESVAELFPAAHSIAAPENHNMLWQVIDSDGNTIGTVLRTSPATDNLVGYQGPTDTLIAFGPDSRVIGIAINKSYDNDPYVGYVRDDTYFKTLFNNRTLNDLLTLDLESGEIEGVSGATMTSMAVTEGMVIAAQYQQTQTARAAKSKKFKLTGHDIGTLLVILLGTVIGMTSLRANRGIRVCFQWVLVIYLGLVAGNLVSQAMLVGWAKHGVPWRAAFGLAILSLAAFTIPITTRRNLYCTHLCPHGALQQLMRHRVKRTSFKLPKKIKRFLSLIPAMLLAWCIMIAMTALGFSLVDIEPFDAYLFRIAGWATISVAVGGLIASLYIPMAYCRYGCPTGALLQFLRFNSASNRWSGRDSMAAGLLGIATILYIWIR